MSRRPLILVIEYDHPNREALRTALEQGAFRVHCAAGEQAALRRLSDPDLPDLILLDLAEETSASPDLVRRIKEGPRTAGIPVVVFHPPGASHPAAFGEADACLPRPADPHDLARTLRRYCGDCADDPFGGIQVYTLHPPAGDRRGRRRVLIVEDNLDGAESLRMLLEMLGHETRVAHTGPEGLRAAREWRPDVVLCDIGLPGLDGYAVAGELRRGVLTAGARLIAVTAYGGSETVRRARASGFDHVLTKPADPAVLLDLVARQA